MKGDNYEFLYSIERVVYDPMKGNEVGLAIVTGEEETIVVEAMRDDEAIRIAELKRSEIQPAVFRREGLKTISVEAVVEKIFCGDRLVYSRDKGGLELFIESLCENGQSLFVIGLKGDAWMCLPHERVIELARVKDKSQIEQVLFSHLSEQHKPHFALSDEAHKTIVNY